MQFVDKAFGQYELVSSREMWRGKMWNRMKGMSCSMGFIVLFFLGKASEPIWFLWYCREFKSTGITFQMAHSVCTWKARRGPSYSTNSSSEYAKCASSMEVISNGVILTRYRAMLKWSLSCMDYELTLRFAGTTLLLLPKAYHLYCPGTAGQLYQTTI